MKPRIVFIHGMFQTAKSWDHWIAFFAGRGFECVAPAWPCHEGAPSDLRAHPPAGLGDMTLDEVVARCAQACEGVGERPIVVGHSVGGLVAQILAARGLAAAAVCIASVAPNDLIALNHHLAANVLAITNPLKRNAIYEMTREGFRANFCNTMTEAEAAAAYAATATHDSRQVLRDCLGRSGRLNLSAPHVPLLFLAGAEDHIIPAALCRRNCEHYTDPASVADYAEFPHRGHFLCGDSGWREVAEYAAIWIERVLGTAALAGDPAFEPTTG